MKCNYCKNEIENGRRKSAKYCNDYCRSMNWKSVKKLRKIKQETAQMIERANIQVSKEVEDLYKKIFGN